MTVSPARAAIIAAIVTGFGTSGSDGNAPSHATLVNSRRTASDTVNPIVAKAAAAASLIAPSIQVCTNWFAAIAQGEVRELSTADFKKMHPAAQVLPAELVALLPRRARGAQQNPVKIPVKLRLDADLLIALKQGGKGWQTRINDALRALLNDGQLWATAVSAATTSLEATSRAEHRGHPSSGRCVMR